MGVAAVIVSRDNQYLKLLRELAQKKYRSRYGLFVAEGKRLVADFLDGGVTPHVVLYGESFSDIALIERLAQSSDKVFMVKDELLRAVCATEESQLLLAALPMPCAELRDFLRTPRRLLFVLSGVSDPGNLGTILRSAAAAGVDGVVVERGSVDVFNPKVVRATMGALVKLPVFYDLEAEEVCTALRAAGLAIHLAAMESPLTYWQLPEAGGCAVVFGSEARGPQDFWDRQDLPTVCIPQQNGVESLNVAMAASIIAFDFCCRRLKSSQ